MRQLTLLRHAKSSWVNVGQSDFERPLNDRGQTDAPRIGQALAAAGIKPDYVIASSAERVRETAALLLPALGLSGSEVDWRQAIYEASLGDLLEIIADLPPDCHSVLLIGHNPTITQTADRLCPNDPPLQDMPTCAAVSIQFNTDDWGQVVAAGGRRQQYLYPKGLD